MNEGIPHNEKDIFDQAEDVLKDLEEHTRRFEQGVGREILPHVDDVTQMDGEQFFELRRALNIFQSLEDDLRAVYIRALKAKGKEERELARELSEIQEDLQVDIQSIKEVLGEEDATLASGETLQ